MSSEDNTKWGHLNKMKNTHFKRSPLRTLAWSNTPTLSPFYNPLSTCCVLAGEPMLPPNRAVTNSDNFSMARTINAIISSFRFFFRVLTCFSFFSWDSSSICLHILFHYFSRCVFGGLCEQLESSEYNIVLQKTIKIPFLDNDNKMVKHFLITLSCKTGVARLLKINEVDMNHMVS